jgi:hypothetical protein
MKRCSLAILFAVATSSLAGCTTKTVDRPVTVTTKLLPELSKPEVVRAAKEVTGESCSRVILSLIPVGVATAESAYAEALAKAPGADALISYEARVTTVIVAPFYYQVCSEVHGYAVSSKSLVAKAAGVTIQ